MPAASKDLDKSYDIAGGERRQITVFFCDFVDSTGLSERQDPEDVRAILQAFQTVCIEAVERFGGAVSGYSGDGILAQFGYPVAIEKAPEAAVRAGLAVIEGIRALDRELKDQYGEPLHVRIGIQTGLVVIGDMGSDRFKQSSALVGEAPNVAARLQALASPDTIVIGGATEILLQDRFELRPLGSQTLKGLTKGILAYEVLRERLLDDPFAAASRHRTSKLIGRDREFQRLLGLWREAETGSGQTVAIIGDAGMGKSRLVHELQQVLRGERFAELRLYGSVHHKNVALYPFIEYVRRTTASADPDEASANLQKLVARLGPVGQSADALRHLQELAFSAPIPQDKRLAKPALVTPETRRKLRDMLLAIVLRDSNELPLMLVMEDAHWLDPTSLELVARLHAAAASRPVLLVITSRGDLPIGGGDPTRSIHRIVLEKLEQSACRGIVLNVAGDRPIPDPVLNWIATRWDGTPLFAEELALAYLETGALTPAPSHGAEDVIGPVETLVPAALHDSLLVRLDRLNHAKQVAQHAAVLGRVFRHDLLSAMLGDETMKFSAGLSQLLESGIIERADNELRAGYRFKHALLRDAAYQSLLRRQRRHLHALVANTIETAFPDIGELEPDLVAQHWASAGEHERAARQGLKAARLSAARSSNIEAMAQATGVFEQAAQLPDGESREDIELEACIAMIGPLIATKGYGAPEVADISTRALDLCRRRKDDGSSGIGRIFPILYCQWSHKQVTGRIAEAGVLAKEFLELAETQSATGPRVVGRRLVGTSLLLAGHPDEARTYLESALVLYDPKEHASLAYTFGTDFGVMSKCHLAIAYWHLGLLDEADAIGDQALKDAARFGHANTIGYALSHECLLRTLSRDSPGLASLARQLVEFSRERELPFWGAIAQGLLGWHEVQSGDTSHGLAMLGAALAFMRKLNLVYSMPMHLTWVAEGCVRARSFDEAGRMLAEALSHFDRGAERWFEPECWRVRAHLQIESGEDTTAAIASLRKSIDLAQATRSCSFALRSTLDLARLAAAQPGLLPEPATDALACALEPFHAETDRADQKEARALLLNLSGDGRSDTRGGA